MCLLFENITPQLPLKRMVIAKIFFHLVNISPKGVGKIFEIHFYHNDFLKSCPQRGSGDFSFRE